MKLGSPASIAGLPGNNAWVKVGPPLSASGTSCGLVFSRAPPHELSLLRLWSPKVVPTQLPPLALATIVFRSVIVPPFER